MPLIKCEDCGNLVSERAGSCPHCGCPVPGEDSELPQAGAKRRVRIVLLLAVAVLIAGGGILGYLTYSKDREYGWETFQNVLKRFEKEQKVVFDREVIISKDRYSFISLDFDFERKVYIEFSVVEGPMIDVITIDEKDLRNIGNMKLKDFIEEKEVTVFNELSCSGRQGRLSSVLYPGKYRVIFDNSDFGQASPLEDDTDETARVHVKISIIEGMSKD